MISPKRYVLNCLCALSCVITAGQVFAAVPRQFQVDLPTSYTWHVGIIGSGGFAPSYQIRSLLVYEEGLLNFSAGFEAGRVLTTLHGPGLLRGKAEALIEVDPLWLIVEPRQTDALQNSYQATVTFAGYKTYGASVTPVKFRWNFEHSEQSRLIPWVDLGGGVLWTAHRFPQGYVFRPGGNTSRINFLPQVGLGEHFFTQHNQSLDFGARFVPIGSAGLGEYNPGVNILQFTIAYTWWKR